MQARPHNRALAQALCRALARGSPYPRQHCRRPSQACRSRRAGMRDGCECGRLRARPSRLPLGKVPAGLPACLAGSGGRQTSLVDATKKQSHWHDFQRTRVFITPGHL